MSNLANVRGRDDANIAKGTLGFDDEKKYAGSISGDSTTDSDDLSVAERNDRELEKHPDQVTRKAQIGQQKAEAAALVWSRTALYCTYAWCACV